MNDHNNAVWIIIRKGKTRKKYNIGNEDGWENIRLFNELIDIVANREEF